MDHIDLRDKNSGNHQMPPKNKKDGKEHWIAALVFFVFLALICASAFAVVRAAIYIIDNDVIGALRDTIVEVGEARPTIVMPEFVPPDINVVVPDAPSINFEFERPEVDLSDIDIYVPVAPEVPEELRDAIRSLQNLFN